MTNSNHSTRRALRGSAAFSAIALLGAGLVGTVALPTAASAQDITSGELSGTVVDATGNPVAGATVVVSANNRNLSRSSTTGSTGEYNFVQLPLGTYTITASAPGFATTRVDGAEVALGGAAYTVRLSASGDAAATDDLIVVTGSSVRALDFSQAATGVVLDVQDISARVPIPRSVEALQLLTPQSVSGDPAFGSVALAGSSVAENIYYINGMNVTNFRTFIGGSTVPFEFYDQVQIKTGGYQAEFGRSTGGAVVALSRSGSNDLEGGANFFYAPAGLRAEQPNTYANLNERDEVEEIEGNLWLSGPIIEDRVYFFGFFNPRYERNFFVTNPDFTGGAFTEYSDVSKTPFYGGKLDVDVFDGHRLELTYFNDSNTTVRTATNFNAAGEPSDPRKTFFYEGGENYIAKYTGVLADWITISGLYGKSNFDRTTLGSDDLSPRVVDSRMDVNNVQTIQGSASFVETGADERELFRFDADIFVDFLGSHHFRAGFDRENLSAQSQTAYSGGSYLRYFNSATAPRAGVAPNTDYVRQIIYRSGGDFSIENTAAYIQDNWDVTDRLNLNLGLRYDRFKNLNAAGNVFTDLDNLWSPRLGATYDVFGDQRTKISAFYGKYYLPVAANTNIRLSGDELYTQAFYEFSGPIGNPTLGTQIGETTVFSDSSNPDPTTLVSTNLEPQYLDEFIVGGEHRFGDDWTVGVNLIYRDLKNVLEDADLGHYAIGQFCADQPEACGGEESLSVGGGGYVLLNPGKDATINVSPQGDFAGGFLTIPAEYIDLPTAKRTYKAVEVTFERAFDGIWSLAGSYTWSESKGNYEGGVKSDNGQDDVGLTQDFDEPGWADGSFGYLPNHRRHTFKLYGSYALTDNFSIGANARVASPRKYGCIGIYPFTDGRAQDPYSVGSPDTWYCGDREGDIYTDPTTGRQYARGSTLIGRGNGFEGDWEKRVDLNLQYRVPVEGWSDGILLKVDVFNIFNFDSPVDFNEYGDFEGVILPVGEPLPGSVTAADPDGTPSTTVLVPLDENYMKPTSYQTPRYIRFGMSLKF